MSGLSFQCNRVCQWRFVWWSQRSRFEAGTSGCMLCYLSVIYSV